MSLPNSWKWLTVSATAVFLWGLGALSLGSAHNTDFQDPGIILKNHYEKIVTLSSDQEALQFNESFIPKLHPARHSPTRRKPSRKQRISNPVPAEIQGTITTFWAAMATIANIQKLREMSDGPMNTQAFSPNLQTDTQKEWIISKSSLKNFKSLLDFLVQLSKTLSKELPPLPVQNDYAQFVSFHDHSHSTMDSLSWTNLLNNGELKALKGKLYEYWQQKDQQDKPPIPASQKQSYVQQYMTEKLLPIFHAYLLTQALEVEAQAYTVAWESWYHIQQWHQDEQTNQAKMRLCGKWKWIIHNHQNHGDHKTTMTFNPPGLAPVAQVQPTTILIHGDTVYLKWTFPQGIQEDSLLLSNRDTRLEGTFTNSLGPHGSISGQRLSHCVN